MFSYKWLQIAQGETCHYTANKASNAKTMVFMKINKKWSSKVQMIGYSE